MFAIAICCFPCVCLIGNPVDKILDDPDSLVKIEDMETPIILQDAFDLVTLEQVIQKEKRAADIVGTYAVNALIVLYTIVHYSTKCIFRWNSITTALISVIFQSISRVIYLVYLLEQ